jgi:hypothetical protein
MRLDLRSNHSGELRVHRHSNYEFLGLHVAPRDFVDATIKNRYATTPPSPL